jgi:tetratricopeptide (TPR) repeat protein
VTTTRATELEQQAVEHARRGDFGPAARTINEELTRLVPDNAGAWTRLARCCLEAGQLEHATAAAEAALQLNPQNTIARNMLIEVERRRMPPPAPAARRTPRSTPAQPAARATRSRAAAAPAAAIDRSTFTTLGHMDPAAALEALAPRLEPLLMALNDRPFADKVVDARNRAAQAGNALFRRNSLYAGEAGHIFAYHYGGRWEPQMNIGLFAAPQWGRDALRAGIGFDLSASRADGDPEAGQLRALAYFERFQQLAGGPWRQLLSTWMSASGGFIQHGGNRPATDMLPSDAVSWLATMQHPIETGWIFCGRWLFPDRSDHAATMADPRQLLAWLEQTFNDLLPLWASIYRP